VISAVITRYPLCLGTPDNTSVSISFMRAALILAFCAAAVPVVCQTAVERVEPSRPVARFQVQDRNMIDALLMFGQQEKIGIGIDYIDTTAFQKKLSIDVRDSTLATVLDQITKIVGYRWSILGRVVTVTHAGAIKGRRNVLNTRIRVFRVGPMPLEQAGCDLKIALYFALNPKSQGLAGDCPFGGVNQRIDGLRMNNSTAREILNALVSQHGSGAWVVQQPPWTMNKDLGFGVWKILAYDRTDGQYSRMLQVRGLGLTGR